MSQFIDVATVWNKYKDQIKSLNNFIIPRQIIGEDVTGIQLHGFCDASESAYGAVLYLQSTSTSGINMVRLICSKTRVAPIKRLTLPRLELCAAGLFGKLYEVTIKSIRNDLDKVFFLVRFYDRTSLAPNLTTQIENIRCKSRLTNPRKN